MPNTNYPKLVLDEKLISGVLAEIESSLAPILAKAEEDSESKEESPGEETPPEKSDAPPSEGSSESDSAEAPSAPAEDSAPEAPPAVPDEAPSAPPVTPAPMDPMQMVASMQDLPLEQIKPLYDAVKALVFSKMQAAQQSVAAPAPAAPMAPAAPAMAAPPPAMKAEVKMSSDNDADDCGPMTKKSESATSEIELLKAELRTTNEKFEVLSKALELVVSTPVRKAVTGISHIAKSEVAAAPLNKSDVDAKLRTHIRNPQLAKSDREAINAYYDSRGMNIKAIEHLLK
jgi:hypothetical protein